MANDDEYVLVWQRHFGTSAWATDCDRRLIYFHDYGRLTDHGWEIDHMTPTSFGGLDAYANKRPRHWQGNRSAGGVVGGLINALSNVKPRGGLF